MTFTYTVSPADWGRIAPVLVLVGMTLVIMLVDLFLPHAGERSKHTGPANFVILPTLAFLGVLGALAATITLFVVGDHQPAFNNMVSSDDSALYSQLIILSACGLGILFSPAYLKRLNLVHQGEYYALLLLSTTGMVLLAAAINFIIVFVGLEMLSLALYILCSFIAQRRASQEAGMKYFLLSSFASAFLLYGIALVYGTTGSTTFQTVASFLNANHAAQSSTLLLIAMGLMVVGFCFKVSAVPFHAWTPDVYQGAPAPITAFMSVGTKAAAFIAFARVFDVALAPAKADWLPIVWVVTILTIVGGNIMALVQSNAKRMLAYSGIAHAGYLLIGIVIGSVVGIAAILFYLLCYVFMNVGAFGVVSLLEQRDNSGLDPADLRGLWYRQPVLAGCLAFFLLALAGFPPMAGFAAKYYLFYSALVGGQTDLLIIGVLASILGMYYYLRVIATMFMEQGEAAVAPATAPTPTSIPSTPRRTPSTSLRSARGGTAVASRPETAAVPKTPVQAVKSTGQEETGGRLNWISWSGIIIAVLGTLAMGTVLAFWLVDLAQQAATMMIH
ncbi:MAG TPA: NADH-quinone oxidoreductase subunit N [Ktedonobacteraceae bacterium]|jgi:NADH-quinone oxidoreductase subunit N